MSVSAEDVEISRCRRTMDAQVKPLELTERVRAVGREHPLKGLLNKLRLFALEMAYSDIEALAGDGNTHDELVVKVPVFWALWAVCLRHRTELNRQISQLSEVLLQNLSCALVGLPDREPFDGSRQQALLEKILRAKQRSFERLQAFER